VDNSQSDQTIRKLTTAVWAVAIALTLNVLATLYVGFALSPFGLAETSLSMSVPYRDELAGFHEWPVEEKIKAASVVAVTIHTNEDGKIRSIISAIPKQSPGTTFAYHVGDEYMPAGHMPRENTFYGDGEVIFFTGSPARMRYSSSYTDGRIGGFGDMPLDAFVESVAQQK
jgi:hypothetical protein